MARQNQNRKQTPDSIPVFKFTGIAMNRDNEPIAITECGKVFRIYLASDGFRTWSLISDYSADHIDPEGI